MWYSVIRFEDHAPNFFESLAHAVPSPHQAASRAANVALTKVAIAPRRLSRETYMRRTWRSAASLSPCPPVLTIRLMPMFVPSAKSTSSSRRRSTARGIASRDATVAN